MQPGSDSLVWNQMYAVNLGEQPCPGHNSDTRANWIIRLESQAKEPWISGYSF
jgi:hypothetical protein